MPAHANGGLVNYTGPSWLDGSPNAPELVLNATDTKNFIVLKDILSEVLHTVPTKTNEENSQTAYVDIDINIDKIDNDYDVEQMAKAIQDYISNEALYRNTTMVSNRR